MLRIAQNAILAVSGIESVLYGNAGFRRECGTPVASLKADVLSALTVLRRLHTKMRNKQKGFSLIELLIVVAIILIIAAIAIPNLIRSRMAANEASAVSTLRTLTTAYVSYSSTYGNGLPPNLNNLGNPPVGTPPDCGTAGSGLVDDVLAGKAAGGTATTFAKSGYNFTYVGANP